MKITSVSPISDDQDYFDITVEDNHNFLLSNGSVVHNCGTGVGFSVERQYIAKLPEVPETLEPTDTVIVVEDSKEGWARAFRQLLSMLWSGSIPKWDVSKVRPAGARLKTFGGRASGPAPLVDLFNFSVATFKKAVGRKLNSLECHDLLCKVGEVVVVGGVRRSATISLSNLSDDRMRHAKSGQWWESAPYRALANNSICYTEKPDVGSFMAEWNALYESKSGERGIFNRVASQKQAAKNERRDTKHDFGTNPCCVSSETKILTDSGEVEISSRVGIKTVIWNGEEWSEVLPFAAGVANLFRVRLSDGSYLDCTNNHKFVLMNALGENVFVQVKDLKFGDVLAYFTVPGQKKQTNVFVKSIVDLERTEMTYCFEEPKAHRGTFNGIVTGQSEIILRPYQFCNLSEVIVRAEDTYETLARKVHLATILGTFQSTLTHFPYLRKIWKRNTEEERLLGVSLTGIMDNAWMNGSEDGLTARLVQLREVAIATNKLLADELDIPQSAAITCVKPSGTVSQLVDAASGIHTRHSPYYLRRVRGDKKDPLTQFLISAGVPCEDDVMKPDSTVVFTFPQKAPEGALTRAGLKALDQLELWLTYQRHWCEHKPSITVSVRDEEWPEVGAWVWKHFDEVSGISFLPYSDHSYQQAPYEECDEETYNALVAAMPEIDWEGMGAFEHDDRTTASQEPACSSGFCEII